MKVLVTGGAGFIGGRIVQRLLKKGFEVHVLGRSTTPVIDGAPFHKVNLAKEEIPHQACDGVDAIFHVAAKAGVWGSAISYHAANILATRRVLKACRLHKIGFLVHTSSPSVVFSHDSIRGSDESIPYGKHWLCHYSRTKAIAEQDILAANGEDGLKTIALRPHLVWGAGDPHLLTRIVSRHKAGKLRIVGDGQNSMDMTHVENVAFAHILALEALSTGNHPGGKAYFITQDEPIALWPWLNSLFLSLELPLLEKRISFRFAYSIGFLMEAAWKILKLGGEPPMTRFVAVQLAKDHWFSITAARSDLGYEPIISMEEGMEETCAWLRNI